MVPKTKFEQSVRKIGQSVKKGLRWQPNAILALHTASEGYLKEVIGKSPSATDHSKCRTTQTKDINLVRQISKK